MADLSGMGEYAVLAATGALLGAATEGIARGLRLWRYRHPALAVLNAVLLFGAAMGALAAAVPRIGHAGAFLAALAVGLVYEWLNLARLHWWHFPGDRFLLVFRGPAACAGAAALLWAGVPLAIRALRAQLPV